MRRSDRSNPLKAVPMPQRHFFHGHRKGRLFPPGLSPPLAEGGEEKRHFIEENTAIPGKLAVLQSALRLLDKALQIVVQTVAAEKRLRTAADHTIRRLLRRTEELFLRPAVGLENQKKSNLRAGDPGKDPAAFLRRIRFPDPCCCLPTPSGQPNSSTQNRSSSNTRPLAIGSLSC